MKALPDAISTRDELTATEPLKSLERKLWPLAIEEQIQTLIDNKTWKLDSESPI